MLDKIKAFFTGAPAARLDARADPRGKPGTRVYHEYFLEDEPRPKGWYWICRVYAQNGAATEREGFADSRFAAGRAAIEWADETKAGLRGFA